MSTHRLSDTVADTVLAGDAAGLRALGRPDLVVVADALAPLRRVAQDGPVQPTPALAALLEHGTRGLVHAPGAAPHTPHPGAGRASRHGRHVTAPTTRRKHMLTEWLGGLGLAAKLSIASAVAAASVGVTGAAGALPTPVQQTFDQTVSAVTPFGDDTTDPQTGIDVEDATPSDGATTDPADDATPGGDASDDPTPGTTDASSSTSAEPSADDSASPDDEATDDDEDADEDGEDHHSSASHDDDGDDDHATSGHRRHRGSDSGRGTSGSRSDDDRSDRSGSGSHEEADDEDHSGHGSGGSDDGEDGEDDHEDEDRSGGDSQDD